MRAIVFLVCAVFSGGILAASDNLNGKKFEQLEQMINDLEGQMTSLSIENALLQDAVSDIEQDLGDAEFEIIQLENTVAILSSGDGEGSSGAVGFVGLTDAIFNADAGFNQMTQACIDKFGGAARMATTEDRFSSNVIVDGDGWANPSGVNFYIAEVGYRVPKSVGITDSTGIVVPGIRHSGSASLNCNHWSSNWTQLFGTFIGSTSGASHCGAVKPVACSAPI